LHREAIESADLFFAGRIFITLRVAMANEVSQKLKATALLSKSLYAAWFMMVGSRMLFHLWRCDDDDADSYWVGADTPAEARRLVALNVGGARDAEDPMRFDCEPSKRKRPPAGFIHRRLTGPVAIQKR
jgi:hypothetical protein